MSVIDPLNPLQLLKEYLSDLKEDLADFNKEYHAEILKIWQEVVRIQEIIKNMGDEQKKQAKIWGLIGGAIPASVTIVIALLFHWLSKSPKP